MSPQSWPPTGEGVQFTILKSQCCSRFVAHHRHELVPIDFTITVSIDVLGDVLYTSEAKNLVDIAALKNKLQLLIGDLAVAVPIEEPKCRPTDVFLNVVPL